MGIEISNTPNPNALKFTVTSATFDTPMSFAAGQETDDGDPIGDACDNCLGVSNWNLGATDCNGDGDDTDPGEGAGEQCDQDGDGCGDDCDSLPTDPAGGCP